MELKEGSEYLIHGVLISGVNNGNGCNFGWSIEGKSPRENFEAAKEWREMLVTVGSTRGLLFNCRFLAPSDNFKLIAFLQADL